MVHDNRTTRDEVFEILYPPPYIICVVPISEDNSKCWQGRPAERVDARLGKRISWQCAERR
eukprot:5466250-Amphidinium_carterae.2